MISDSGHVDAGHVSHDSGHGLCGEMISNFTQAMQHLGHLGSQAINGITSSITGYDHGGGHASAGDVVEAGVNAYGAHEAMAAACQSNSDSGW